MVTPASPKQPVTIAKPPHATTPAGILPVSTAGSKPKVTSGQSARHQPAGLKVNIRRLPPGFTEEEFKIAFGEEWCRGSRNVNWYSYVPGKVSKDPAKPSRPSRAYLHLSEAYVKEHAGEPLKELQAKASSANFVDAKGTHHDPALLPPWPTVVEAPYGRIPSTKLRKDNRQGTIDQDPEFIDFLQELTNPLVKPTPIDAVLEKESKSDEKPITPLVQYLKDKKANKAKEAKAAKQSKQDSKDGKASDKKSSKGSKETEKKSSKPEKATKEPIKLLHKKGAQNADAKSTSKGSTAPSGTPSEPTEGKAAAPTPTPKPEKKRERGSVAAAAKILQRDLGLGGAGAGRRRKDATKGAKDASTEGQTTQTPAAPANPAASSERAPNATSIDSTAAPTVPSVAQNSSGGAPSKQSQAQPSQRSSKAQSQAKQNQSTKPAPTAKATGAPNVPTVTPTATAAFLKHANPSQGITEVLLQSTFANFGTVTKVEIDKKKGFAYVDFTEPEALQKAIAASPVKIAQGAVVVLERKIPTSQTTKSARPEGRGGRGGGANTSQRGGRGRGRGGRQQGAAGGDAGGGAKATEAAPASTA